jgi:MFS family permease
VLVWKGLGQQAAANVYALTAVPMTLAWGFLGDRWPAHRVYAATILFAVGGMAILVFNHQIWMLYVFAVVWGISDAGIPLTFSIMGNFFGRKSFATLRGIQASIFAVASFGAPVFAGAVYDRTESYLYALVPGLIALCVAAPAFYLLPHPREPGAPSQGVGTPQAAG